MRRFHPWRASCWPTGRSHAQTTYRSRLTRGCERIIHPGRWSEIQPLSLDSPFRSAPPLSGLRSCAVSENGLPEPSRATFRRALVPSVPSLWISMQYETVPVGACGGLGATRFQHSSTTLESVSSDQVLVVCAPGGDKQVDRIAQPEEVFAPAYVLRQHGARGRMQRHQPRSAKLGGVDGRHGLL